MLKELRVCESRKLQRGEEKGEPWKTAIKATKKRRKEGQKTTYEKGE